MLDGYHVNVRNDKLVLETEILDFLNIFYNRVEVKLDKVNDSLCTISIQHREEDKFNRDCILFDSH